ncbi:MAG: serine/threonine protein kinase [Myxococcales bacterium]|nr:serine/threonine protein kinase [Myxococcales bacterium]
MSSPGAERGSGDPTDDPPSGVTTVSGTYRAGEIIDEKYILIRKIGEGGMGAVWIAHNSVLDVHCAVKLIENASKQVAERVLDEARSAAKLGHPAIVRVLDYGHTGAGDPFIAMELLDGEDLAQLMERQGRLPPTDAVQMLLPIAHALATAHAKGIVHRDVKPENIFLARSEVVTTQPKLLDFGIVRVEHSNRRLTIDGAVLGTPDYMSPEAARGEEINGQTDIWGFCVVLYELMRGNRPFDGDNYNALMFAIINDEPKSLAEQGVGDEELSAIVQRGLKKSKDDRWATMRDLGEELALWLESQGVSDDITGTSLRRGWLAETESKRIELPPYVRDSLRSAAGESPAQRARREASVAVTGSGPSVSDQELAAIAELHAEGDPEELLSRATRRRNVAVVLGLVVVIVGTVLAVLIGTGIILPS